MDILRRDEELRLKYNLILKRGGEKRRNSKKKRKKTPKNPNNINQNKKF